MSGFLEAVPEGEAREGADATSLVGILAARLFDSFSLATKQVGRPTAARASSISVALVRERGPPICGDTGLGDKPRDSSSLSKGLDFMSGVQRATWFRMATIGGDGGWGLSAGTADEA